MTFNPLNGIDLANQLIINVGSPSAGTDAANKQYVDNLVAGLSYKDEVRAATTANGTLATAYANGSVIDGITLATNDRILIKDQTTQTENGLYKVNASGAPTRTTDADSTAELNNATVYVTSGTVNGGREYTQSTQNPTIGTSNIVFVQKTTGTIYTADGNGIELSAGTFSLELDTNSGLLKSSTGLKVDPAIAGNGLTMTTGVLNVVGGSGITVAADLVSVDKTVVMTRYAASYGDGTTTSYTITHNLGTKDVHAKVYRVSDGIEVQPDIDYDTGNVNTLSITHAVAPTTNQYRVVVLG